MPKTSLIQLRILHLQMKLVAILISTTSADFLIEYQLSIHLTNFNHLSKDFLLLYVAELVKSVNVFI